MNFPVKARKAVAGLFGAAAGGALAVADPSGSARYTATLTTAATISASGFGTYHLWSMYEESMWSDLVDVLSHAPYDAWTYEAADPILGEAVALLQLIGF